MAADGTVFPGDGKAGSVSLSLKPGAISPAALRLEVLPFPGQDLLSGTITLSARIHRAGAATAEPLLFSFADASAKTERFSNGLAIPGILSGWKLSNVPASTAPCGIWLMQPPLTMGPEDTLTVLLSDFPFRSLRLSWSPFAPPLPPGTTPWMASLATALADPQGANLSQVNQAWLTSTAADPGAYARYQDLATQRRRYHEGRTTTLVTRAMPPLTVRVRPRGNWQDDSGSITPPATPHFLPGPRPAADQRLSRLDLANWITSGENPLTARTVMNRLWKQFFGTGLSAVVDDLGAQG